MASIADPQHQRVRGSTRFFTIMAVIMSLVIVAGFSVQLAMGRSTFSVPWPYHVHGVIFMSWIGLYLAQHFSISAGNVALHRTLGKLAYFWIPLMVVFGTVIMIVVARRTGGPFFFHVSEFLWSNIMLVWCFGGLAWWALRRQRYTGWHRRLMLCAMAILTGPGLGRLLPAPLMIPHAWTIITLCTMVWPLIGMIVDWRRDGRVHSAYWWGLGIYFAVFVIGLAVAHTGFGMNVTESVIAGTPGAERPMEAFLPPGFTM
ncbi:hypothetical protein [Altererythrobacter sp. MF3-039]|uniref:hypothetical protein n=1 Tax=Altererythrobacter sp. MF3-039 TaxID=3252901 RepID=UPI00390CBD75